MGICIPSETQLAEAIQALKPGAFERFVEGYLRAKKPSQFRNLTIVGRNPDDKTRQGWPDAEVRRTDGRIDAIEITQSENWRQHLRADLQRIGELGGRLASFHFVAWANAPSREDDQTLRETIAACGIPLEEVHLLFRNELLFDLSNPRYAQLWADPLDLPLTCYPFVPIDEAFQLFGSEAVRMSFSPTRNEFLQGRVYEPTIQEAVREHLNKQGWAFLRGKGASGKTTIAISLALSRENKPTYYIDLTDWSQANEPRAIDSLLERTDIDVLFIIDNVHLEPAVARRLFDAWRRASRGSNILLVGRVTTPRPHHRGYAHPLSALATDAFELIVKSVDLLEVYRRLLHRLYPQASEPPVPPAQVLDNWLHLFGGDLLAFSTAVLNRAIRLSQGDFTLTANDARDYVYQEYLHGLDPAEVQILCSLAVLSEIEISASVLSIGGHLPSSSLERGLVLRITSADDESITLRLVHPGMGYLVLAAAGPVDRYLVLRQSATTDPATGLAIVRRLRRLGHYGEARQLLKDIVAQKKWASDPFMPLQLSATARRIRRSGILSMRDLETNLLAQRDFLPALLTTPLHGLTPFLLSARRQMPELYKAATFFLSEESSSDWIVKACLNGRPRLLPQFLKICREEIPRLAKSLSKELQTTTSIHLLVANLLAGPVADIGIFLRDGGKCLPRVKSALADALRDESISHRIAARTLDDTLSPLELLMNATLHGAPTLFNAIVDVLGTPEGVKYLSSQAARTDLRTVLRFLVVAPDRMTKARGVVEAQLILPASLQMITAKILKMPIGDITASVTLADSVVPSLGVSLRAALSEPAHVSVLVEKTKVAPLDTIGHVLQFSQPAMPDLYDALRHNLADPAVVSRLRDRSIETPVSQITTFLRLGEVAVPFARALNLEWLAAKKETLSIESLGDISRLVIALRANACFDVAEKMAQDALLETRHGEWKSGFMLLTLGSLLQSAAAAPASVDRFLTVMCTEAWLCAQVSQASPGALAGALFRLWSALTLDQLQRFQLECMSKAIRQHCHAASNRPADIEGVATAISLIGVGSLLGFNVDPATIKALNLAPLETILSLRDPSDEAQVLSVGEVQLWLGLRVLAGHGCSQMSVGCDRGDLLLQRFRAAETNYAKYDALNKDLLAWLGRCANSKWMLIPS